MYEKTTLGPAVREPRAGKNHTASVWQLGNANKPDVPFGLIHFPSVVPVWASRISVRVPAERARSIRLSAVPEAKNVMVPLSVVDPAVHVALPVSVTSVIVLPPVSAAMA